MPRGVSVRMSSPSEAFFPPTSLTSSMPTSSKRRQNLTRCSDMCRLLRPARMTYQCQPLAAGPGPPVAKVLSRDGRDLRLSKPQRGRQRIGAKGWLDLEGRGGLTRTAMTTPEAAKGSGGGPPLVAPQPLEALALIFRDLRSSELGLSAREA